MATAWIEPQEAARRASTTGGELGARTDDWRTLNWHLGDLHAHTLCAWCDAQPDPAGAMAALLTVVSLATPHRHSAVVAHLTALGDGAWAEQLRAAVEQDWPPL